MNCKQAKLVGASQLAVEQVAFPRVVGNPIVRVTHVGICGSDVHLWEKGGQPQYQGLVMGHEYAGVVEEPGTSGLARGQRVTGYTQNVLNEACGMCAPCLEGDAAGCTGRTVQISIGCEVAHPGAYSEYVTWYPGAVFPLPDTVSNEEAALIEPAAVGLHAVRLVPIQPGQSVLVLGGGIIGLSVAEWARVFGAGKIVMTELDRAKRERIAPLAEVDALLAADDAELEDKILAMFPGGVDYVFDCVGIQATLSQSIRLLGRGGSLVMVGVPQKPLEVDAREMVLRQKFFLGSKGHRPDEFLMVLRTLAAGKLDLKKYITGRFPLDNAQDAFLAIKGDGSHIKVLIECTPD